MAQASCKVTIECDLTNDIIFNDLERPLNVGFIVTVLFRGEYLKNSAF